LWWILFWVCVIGKEEEEKGGGERSQKRGCKNRKIDK